MPQSSHTRLTVAEREQLLKLAEAAHLDRRTGALAITPSDRTQVLPLSFAQQRLWFLAQLGEGGHAYHVPAAWRFEGPLDRDALRRALDRIVDRHEALRTTFERVHGRPVQRIASPDGGCRLVEDDLRGHAASSIVAERLIADEATAPFALDAGPLIRGRLIRLADAEHVLLITAHHIVSDGWSMGVLKRELAALYNAFRDGRPDPLPPLEIQYADYACWQRQWLTGDLLHTQSVYWQRTLAGAPALLELPTDFPRPAERTHEGADLGLSFDAASTRKLKSLGRRHATTLFATVLTAWAVVLARMSGQTDLVIGVPIANRSRAEIEPLIGFFVNTLALRVDLSGRPTVTELLQRVRGQVQNAQQHQDLPFEQVVDLIKPARSLAHSPVFQVTLTWQHLEGGPWELPGVTVTPVRATQASAKFDLSLELAEVDDGIIGRLTYATALFTSESARRYAHALQAVLAAMVADEGQVVDRIAIVSPAERHQILETWNATTAPYPRGRSVAALVAAQAAVRPEAIAVVAGEAALTYGALDTHANRLAHYLRQGGVGPDQRVALCGERSLELVMGLLAVLKAGGAYVPLDPSYPVDRLVFMLGDSQPSVVLTTGALPPAVRTLLQRAPGAPRLVDLEVDAARWADAPVDAPVVPYRPEHLAYVIYTSGSTGQPKGVMGAQGGVVNLLAWLQATYALDARDALLQKAPVSFDVSVWELFWPLSQGARLVLAPPGSPQDPRALTQAIQAEQVTTLHFVPSLLQALLGHDETATWPSVTRVLCGGEPLSGALARRVGDRLPAARLFNQYGPTETTVDVTAERYITADRDRVTIGRPIANTQAYVLDPQLAPTPIGVVGELYIGGVGLARGYWRRPALTASRFIAHPFGAPGARLYRTGDLARWRPDGRLECVGREDFQVKVRGVRLELGEIEASLLAYPGVQAAVVVARADTGDVRLTAYYTRTPGTAPIGVEALRRHLLTALPPHLTPAAYVALDALPLTPAGKVDRAALPAPGSTAYVTRTYEAPADDAERAIAAIWAELLGVERVGRHDNFFELGGHSLLAVSVMDRMREAGLPADVRALFATPTLAALAAAASAAAPNGAASASAPPNAIPPNCAHITPDMLPLVTLIPAEIARIVEAVPGGAVNVQDIYPLAPLQEGILFHHLLQEDDPYVVHELWSCDSRERVDGFVAALQTVIDRYDIFRTAVMWEGLPEPVQVVWRRAPLVVDAVGIDVNSGDVAAQLQARFDRRRLEVREAPMMRVAIAEDVAHDRWLVSWRQHHLIGDHTTMAVVRREMRMILAGRVGALPAPLPFRGFVAQARLGVSRAAHTAFFSELLRDVVEPTTPYGLTDVHGAADVAEVSRTLDAELVRRLRTRARVLGVSAATLCHLAFAQVLARLSGRTDLVFGTVLFGRMQGSAGVDWTPGLFINTLPVRIRLGEDGVETSVRQVQTQLANLLAHEHASLALVQRCSGVAAPAPLFSAILNYRYNRRLADRASSTHGPGWEGISLLGAADRTNYPFVLSIADGDDGLSVSAQVAPPGDAAKVCVYMQTALERLLEALEQRPTLPVRRVDVLPAAERQQLAPMWRAAAAAPPRHQLLSELFEAQALERPDSVAVVAEGQALTYGALNARANRLAHHLRRLGVRPDARVALCFERGIEQVVAVLAVLKAGGAYVPLDPSYPAERLAFMLADSAPVALLTARGAHEALGSLSLPVLDLSAADPVWASAPDRNPASEDVGLTPAHLAYLIYTSGSTGAPKGVMVEHRQVARLFSATAAWFGFSEADVWTLFHSYAFDFSVWEIWGAWRHGGRLIVVPQETTRSPAAFVDLIAREGVTVLNQTPSAFRQLVSALPRTDARSHRLRAVIFGGEALDLSLLPPWYAHHAEDRPTLVNMYGITETTVHVTYRSLCVADGGARGASPIGRAIPDLQTYILDPSGEPAPVGTVGELYVGGAGLARGYWRRPALTAARFVANPFGPPGDRLYRTGDLARWRPDGLIEFIGRNDFQVKVRGLRIELGEIEERLRAHPGVRDAVVLAREAAAGDTRLAAYYVPTDADGRGPIEVEALRRHLAESLPDYMVPAAYVALAALPMTPSGKLDRGALPAPRDEAYATHAYEAPVDHAERVIAAIWAELLGVERVGRHDNFFALGGHSLVAVSVIERMRQAGVRADVRALFATPTLAALAAAARGSDTPVVAPPNAIPAGCVAITPAMLPLVALSAAEIARIVATVPGGAANIQDIYPLAPLQEGILFHHLLRAEDDPYVVQEVWSCDSRARVDAFVAALQAVIDRHDIFRTAVLWDGLSEPVQVVWRRASLRVEELALDRREGDVATQLRTLFDRRRQRLDVRAAPMMRVAVVADAAHDRWLLLWRLHHLVGDHTTLTVMRREMRMHLAGRREALPTPLPFRNFVAQARMGIPPEAHAAFFRKLLGDVTESTTPYGFADVRGDAEMGDAWQVLDDGLARRLRRCARGLGVSTASVCHLAFALVLARVSGRTDVVFGTTLFGRMQGGDGADWLPGLFINTLPVRIRLDEAGVEASVRRVQTQLGELLRHEHASLALAQRCSGVAAPAPLFSAVLNYRRKWQGSLASSTDRVPAWEGIRLLSGAERSNYPLAFAMNDLGSGFSLDAQVARPGNPASVCASMQTALTRLVDALEQNPTMPVRALDVMPETERRQILDAWNATATAYPANRCVPEVLEAQAIERPNAVAVVAGAEALTYDDLNARANRLARHLRRLGVGPDQRVGLYVERSLELVVGLLAVMKAGGAYVPLDPSYPAERLAFMLADSQPLVVLTHGALTPAVRATLTATGHDHARPLLDLTADASQWAACSPATLDPRRVGRRPEHLAYVMYTSGSTGVPKGVMVTYAGLANTIHYAGAALGLHEGDAMGVLASVAFDICGLELMTAWGHGGRSVIVGRTDVLDVERLVARAGDLTFLHAVPSVMSRFIDAARTMAPGSRPGLRGLLVGGERVSATLLEAMHEVFPACDRRVLYGPTEASMICASLAVGDAPLDGAVGRPIANMRMHVLDAQLEPAPVGVVGELYIGGIGLARGYWRRPSLTAARFVADPYGPPGARLYRTGDLGRYRPDATIEFVGRDDAQIKVRGVRIELGEIEAQLRACPGVREAVVVARDDATGDTRLAAYFTTAATEAAPVAIEELRRHLADVLPDYMVPAAFVALAAMPLTPNGKVDRAALPAPDAEAHLARAYEAPRGGTERRVADIWADLLGIARVGRHDNFFELGGHSLLAVRVISRLRQALGLELDLTALFDRPVLSAFAEVVDHASRAVAPPITPVQRDGEVPLSFAQQRLWFLAQMGEGSQAYHIRTGWRLRGPVDRAALRGALDGIVARHEALRTTFARANGQPVQRIAPPDAGFALTEHDVRDHAAPASALDRLVAEEADAPFDLAAGPLIRGRLIRVDEVEHVLLVTMHHIVADGWSMGVFTRELAALYRACCDGQPDPLPRLNVQYADYASWQRRWLAGDVLQSQTAYWRQTLAGAPERLELPTDFPRPAEQTYAGATTRLTIDAALTAGLKALSARHGATLFMTVLSAWAVVLARMSGQHDLVIGVPVANRTRAEIEPLIGFFVNTLALRLDVGRRPTIAELIQRVRAQVQAAQQHQDLPFEQVVDLVKPARSLSHSPVFQVTLAWQHVEGRPLDLPRLTATPTHGGSTSAQFDLTLDLAEVDGRILGSLIYARALFTAETAARYADALRHVLAAMVGADDRPVDRLAIVGPAERQRILDTWNATTAPYPSDRCVHELLEMPAHERPDAIAVVADDQALSYAELHARANRLAHHLQQLGVGPALRVAVCVERGVELVVGLLAVLKAGGAYVPLDPTYPADRLAFMLRDSQPLVVLTHRAVPPEVRVTLATAVGDGHATTLIDLDADAGRWAACSAVAPAPGDAAPRPDDLAYVIYTSGSTGVPKGVMVSHRAVVNFLSAMRDAVGMTASDVLLAITTVSFDIAALELFLPLLVGARTHVAARAVASDPERLQRALQTGSVSVLQATPSAWRLLLTLEPAAGARVLRGLCGGEALPPELAERLLDRVSSLWNVYGPTETTIWSTIDRPARGDRITIGRPLANTRVYVLDEQLEPTPVGAVGDLYIGGVGVAGGYWRRPSLTAARFVADPHGPPGERVYRTGDLARYRPDGRIEYVGRDDFQVKLRGFRIELGEIEAQLAACPGVREAVVVARQTGGGDTRLAAYVTTTGPAALPVDELRRHLSRVLPEYMVPATYVALAAMPLTLNGKVDRAALPEPGSEAHVTRAYEAPQGETERRVAAIWAEVLGLEQVGRHDNFFELGGHSLLAVGVIERMRQAGLQADVRALFATASLASLASATKQIHEIVL